MHELSITQSMLEIVLQQAEKAKAKKVTKINLIIGEMTGVVSDSVQFYLDILTKTPSPPARRSLSHWCPHRASAISAAGFLPCRNLTGHARIVRVR